MAAHQYLIGRRRKIINDNLGINRAARIDVVLTDNDVGETTANAFPNLIGESLLGCTAPSA
jgi:hypothetical protein